jgi:AAA15 family ATPase/GTPase
VYRSFKVSNFRCFRELNLPQLERVNLIAGMGNVGKTALLEALFLHCGAYNPELTLRLDAFRGIEHVKVKLERWAETPWDSLFSQFDTSKRVELAGENEQTGYRILRLQVIRQPEELAKIGRSIQHTSDKSKGIPSFSSEMAKVLELESTEGNQRRKYYMILDPGGVRSEPIPPPPPFPASFLPARMRIYPQEDAERFGNLEILGQQDALLKALQVIEARLRRLAVASADGIFMIHGDIGLGRLVPLPLMGDGMTRLASLVLAIGNAPNGVVLVDEIENGLYHSVLPKVWQAIGQAARQFNTQVFATTHSRECIVAAHRAFSESERYDFRLHRLERVNETIRAVTYDRDTLEAAIETDLEVR